MSLGLPDDLARFVHDAVAAGVYPSQAALLEQAVRMLKQHEQLKRDVQEGIDQLDRGEGIPAEVVFERLRQKIELRRPAP